MPNENKASKSKKLDFVPNRGLVRQRLTEKYTRDINNNKVLKKMKKLTKTIEKKIFQQLGDNYTKYNNAYRRILHNKTYIKPRLLSGEIKPSKLPKMHPRQMRLEKPLEPEPGSQDSRSTRPTGKVPLINFD